MENYQTRMTKGAKQKLEKKIPRELFFLFLNKTIKNNVSQQQDLLLQNQLENYYAYLEIKNSKKDPFKIQQEKLESQLEKVKQQV